MKNEFETSAQAFFKKKNELVQYSSTLTDYKDVYTKACLIAQYDIGVALTMMVQAVVIAPVFMDEAIRDSIFLWVQSEGNRSVYYYLIEQLKRENSETAVEYLNDMIESLNWKYEKLGMRLKE